MRTRLDMFILSALAVYRVCVSWVRYYWRMPKRQQRRVLDLSASTLIDIGNHRFVDPSSGMVLTRVGHLNSFGYERVRCESRQERYSHALVWEAVNGPIPPGFHINHKDGDKLNNSIDNLEAVTAGENIAHAYATGLRTRDGGFCVTKLTEDQAKEIRWSTESCTALAQWFGISRGHAWRIKQGETWTHLT